MRRRPSIPYLFKFSPESYLSGMSDVTQILCANESGEPRAASELLPPVDDELRYTEGMDDGRR
jgi:hypothetical protein